MTELGRPFSEPYEDVIAALEDHIRNGVQHARFVFEGVEGTYQLPEMASAVTLVSGLRDGEPYVFDPGADFRFVNGRIVWLPSGDTPDPGSRFEVRYTYRGERPANLTDFNAGSVIATLVRAVARQMTLIYDQMDEAYRRAFIDEATGVALDNVVALLGITRNPALTAKGEVTFYRRRAADRTVVIPEGTRVADERGRTFVTRARGEISPQIDEFATPSDGVLRTTNRIAELIGVWRREDDPETAPPLAEEGDVVHGEDERTVTLKSGAWPEGQLLIRYKPKSVTVPVEAMQPGPEGNVDAETIVIMPTPPRNVDGVVNEERLEGGQPAESDNQLRERAKHALERAGNATLNAIKFAVLDVDGVEGVEVIDHSVDDAVPLGEVRVRYSGGESAQVESAIDNTRAAGILARPDEVERVLISGTFYLIPEPSAPATAAGQFLSTVVEAIRALTIGEPLSVRRLNALAYNVPGLADVAEAQLYHGLEGSTEDPQPVPDPLLVDRSTLITPHPTDLEVVLVSAIEADRSTEANNRIQVQLMSAGGQPIEWRNLSLDISVVLRAHLSNAPEQPPERVGSFTRTLVFSGQQATTATLTITAADAPGFRPADHEREGVEVAIGAAAYPGIGGAETSIDLPTGT